MTIDMSRYLGIFVTEATEHLEELGRDLVQLEKDQKTSNIDSMFRHAHSVKGMASSMGYEPIATLAHRVEDLVDAVRSEPKRLSMELVDLLLSATDTMLAQVRATGAGQSPEPNAALHAQLSERLGALTGRAPEKTRVANAVVTPAGDGAGVGARGSTEAGGAGAGGAGAGSSGVGAGAGASGGGEGAGASAGGTGASGAGSHGAGAGGSGAGGGGASGAGASGGGVSGAGVHGAGASGAGAHGAGASGAGASGGGASGAGVGAAAGAYGVGASGAVGASGVGAHDGGGAGGAGAGAHGAGGAGAAGSRAGGAGASGAGVLGATGAGGAAVSGAGAQGAGVPGARATGSGASAASGEPGADAGRSTSATGLGLPPRYGLRLRISPTCQAPGVRAFLVYKRLSSIGNVFDLRPSLEDLKAGRIPEGLISLELESGAGEAGVISTLKNVSEVELVAVRVIPQSVPPPTPAPAPAPAAAPEAGKVVRTDTARTVRVRTELLDYFLDTVGELLLATARIREVGKALPGGARPQLEEAVDRLHGLVKDLHDKVMSARMTPLAVITDRLPRAARDIARRRERDVDLVITGAEIELDRAIIDELSDPVLHILRNCIDHGIESPDERVAAGKAARGRILFSVRRQRDRVVLEIEDDGRGMDAAKLKASAVGRGLLTADTASRMSDRDAFMLACLPGVSTAKDVSEISGRGVGMDSVKRSVENVGGALELESERGRGTRFTLRLPLTVAVVNLLLVEVGEEILGLPIGKVLGAVEADPAKLSHSRETPMLPHGTGMLPVHGLAELLGIPAPARIGTRPYIVMEGEPGKVALAVDRLLGQEEVVLKALSRPLDLIPGLSGVTILGSGRPVFILDVPRLLVA